MLIKMRVFAYLENKIFLRCVTKVPREPGGPRWAGLIKRLG